MQFSDDVPLRIIGFLLGICGFMVAKHIHKHKTENTPLVCPVGFDCHTVVHSDYSKFFGVPVELIGMIYYALVSLAYFIFIFWGEIAPETFVGSFMIVSLIAFLFSLYLVIVQFFILKKACSWCIISSVISISIFILTIFAYDVGHIAQFFMK